MAVTPATAWQEATARLAEAVARLNEASDNRQVALIGVRRTAVETALASAVKAASAFAASGAVASAVQQSQWTATLIQMEAALKRAMDVVQVSDGTGGSPLDAGVRIPGTAIVVPWAAVIGVGAVALAAWYFSRQRGR